MIAADTRAALTFATRGAGNAAGDQPCKRCCASRRRSAAPSAPSPSRTSCSARVGRRARQLHVRAALQRVFVRAALRAAADAGRPARRRRARPHRRRVARRARAHDPRRRPLRPDADRGTQSHSVRRQLRAVRARAHRSSPITCARRCPTRVSRSKATAPTSRSPRARRPPASRQSPRRNRDRRRAHAAAGLAHRHGERAVAGRRNDGRARRRAPRCRSARSRRRGRLASRRRSRPRSTSRPRAALATCSRATDSRRPCRRCKVAIAHLPGQRSARGQRPTVSR